MTKDEIIHIVSGMGFHLDLDRWSEKEGWIRFCLKDELDEKDLRLIWYKEDGDYGNFARASTILFKAGQKAKIQEFTRYTNL